MFRKTLFWAHLVCGVIAGLVILMMSFTGVLLTYERQILAWAEKAHYVPPAQQVGRLTLDQLHFIASTEHPEFTPTSIVLMNDPGAPVTFAAGRRGGFSLNPYTGEEMEAGSPALEKFFSTTTGIHRWFNMTGESRNTARAITGASNLMFLFLVLSGIYLWLPKTWKWAMFRMRLAFRGTAGNSRARDFNWHHVFGIWAALPLVVVVATASVFYYPWANNLVYQAWGEEPPSRGSGPGGSLREDGGSVPVEPDYLGFEELFVRAASTVEAREGNWRQISLNIPGEDSSTISFAVDQGNGGQPQYRSTLVMGRETGEVSAWQSFSSQSPGRQTRSIIRFLHTGEVLGIAGQTLAGLVSLASLFMVWTGLALAWRRLITPLLRKKAAAQP